MSQETTSSPLSLPWATATPFGLGTAVGEPTSREQRQQDAQTRRYQEQAPRADRRRHRFRGFGHPVSMTGDDGHRISHAARAPLSVSTNMLGVTALRAPAPGGAAGVRHAGGLGGQGTVCKV
jgi:hypothetical protein